MDLNEIKKLIEEEGKKIIIVENGEPIMVITSFADYTKKKLKPEKKIDKAVPQEPDEEELKIDDLPF